MRFGFVKDENNMKLKEVFRDNADFKTVHIDIYSDNPLVTSSFPFMLLLRTSENNVIVENNNDRLILKKDDAFNTYIMNVLLSEITGCYCESLINHFEFVLKIQNIYYRITVVN